MLISKEKEFFSSIKDALRIILSTVWHIHE